MLYKLIQFKDCFIHNEFLLFARTGAELDGSLQLRRTLDNLEQLGDAPAAVAIERALRAILASEPQMGPTLAPEDG